MLILSVVGLFGVVAAYLASAGEQQFTIADGCDNVGRYPNNHSISQTDRKCLKLLNNIVYIGKYACLDNMKSGSSCSLETFSNATCPTALCVFHKVSLEDQ
jgi:hypothetical protein